VPTPGSSALERIYYPGPAEIAAAVRATLAAATSADMVIAPEPIPMVKSSAALLMKRERG